MTTPIIRYGRKRSGIRRELKEKTISWLNSITDEDVRKSAAKDIIITGGSIASMLLGEPVNDFDCYFRTKATTLKVARYYVDEFNKKHKVKVSKHVNPYTPEVREETMVNAQGEEEDRVVIYIKSAGVAGEAQSTYSYFESKTEDETKEFVKSTAKKLKKGNKKHKRYQVTFLSDNAITLTNKMQIIIRFYGEPDKIHSNYDFQHAMSYYDHHKEQLVIPADAMESMMSRHLIYRGSLYPIASIFRMKKFIERGWRITAGQQLKIMWQISELDLKNKQTLREQLVGVDMAYMHQLIEALKDIKEEKINASYVATVIDRIFD